MRGDGTTRAERVIREEAGQGIASTVLLTFVDGKGTEWLAGASMTRLRPKGAPLDSEVESIQLTEAMAEEWRLKEFKVVTP